MTVDKSKIALQTQDVYERNAVRFDAERPKNLHERAWLNRFTCDLAKGASVLDLGCGAGDPIAFHLMDRGFIVTGIDASTKMIALAQQRRPDGDWRVEDMRNLVVKGPYDGIIGWNSFFHLTRAEQRALLPQLTAMLTLGGKLMLTVGPSDGEEIGQVGDAAIYHASLAPEEYKATLAADNVNIIEFVVEDPDCDFQTVLLAQKGAGSSI
ncbi:MAG: methyltransferase domain-containing protein [Alphaproteobacteria bacterium]|nr:methyltransferase domain-containing protein [Alphaproteobacteria bacterium]